MDDIKRSVRETYGEIARQAASGCGCGCGPVTRSAPEAIGYDPSDVAGTPDGADLGLGCGNPTAIAGLQEGEVVLDLGSGGGFDCFLAANAVGPAGSVIGVDMTPEMIDAARENARRGGYDNVEFRLGEIESLPVADGSVDVVISNCVINLVPDKPRAFSEAYRVLRPGGRLHVSDIVLEDELPTELSDSVAAYVSCVAGAVSRDEYLAALRSAGFREIEVVSERDALELLNTCGCAPPDEEEGEGCCDGEAIELREGLVTSLTLSARKPAGAAG